MIQRPDQSAREIEALPPLGSLEMGAYLEERGPRLRPETLVYLMREFWDLDRVKLVDRCASLLFGEPLPDGSVAGGHCEAIIRNRAEDFALDSDPDDALEFRRRVYEKALDEILAGRDKYPDWERVFFARLKDRAVDVARKTKKERERYVELEPDSPGAEVSADSEERAILSTLTVKAIRRAIRKLPKRQRQAAFLTWVLDLPIESKESDKRTVSKVMGITARMVRKLLTNARKALGKDPTFAEEARRWTGTTDRPNPGGSETE